MKIFKMTCGKEILLDDEDFDSFPKTGWYLVPKELHNSRADYAQHDTYGKAHRFVLKLTDPTILVDHIDGNGLNNQKSNLRQVSCSENKRNQKPIKSNSFNFNGISIEKGKRGSPRIRVRWSTFEIDDRYGDKRRVQKSKSFSIGDKNPDLVLKEAVLFRINKMKEFGYILDERSTTIEKYLLETEKPNMSELLDINYQEILSRVGLSKPKWD